VEDLIICAVFGLIGYFLFKHKWPVQCIVLGLVLGSLAEKNFHRALQISDGSYSIFVTKPMSLAVLIIIVVIIGWTYLGDPIKKLKAHA
jgi:putative tricarboxylic transport membrane protein